VTFVIYAVGLLNGEHPAGAMRARHELGQLTEKTGGFAYYPASLEGDTRERPPDSKSIHSRVRAAQSSARRILPHDSRQGRGAGRFSVRTRASYYATPARSPQAGDDSSPSPLMTVCGDVRLSRGMSRHTMRALCLLGFFRSIGPCRAVSGEALPRGHLSNGSNGASPSTSFVDRVCRLGIRVSRSDGDGSAPARKNWRRTLSISVRELSRD
jgi:hypothetical protein